MSAQMARYDLASRYPVIALALAQAQDNLTLHEISVAIDRDKSPEEAIPKIIGVRAAAVWSLKNINPETVTKEWYERPIELLWAMDVLQTIRWPQTEDEWLFLRKLWINTGLEQQDAYRYPARIKRDQELVLEYIFRGLCAQGYGEPTRILTDRLAALLPGIETDLELFWPFHGYVSFVDSSLLCKDVLGRMNSLNNTERLLMRYSPNELIRQWESWRCIVAAHGRTGVEVAWGPNDIEKTHWIMRLVIPDFDEAIRWLNNYPGCACERW